MANPFKASSVVHNPGLLVQIRWIVLARAVFSVVLIFSTLFISGKDPSAVTQPFASLYHLAVVVLALSGLYLAWLRSQKHLVALAYLQTIADTLAVTFIVFLTGGFHSGFTFLYLVVVIYTSMLLFQKGSLVIATLASIQYGLLMELEYFQIISPFIGDQPIYLTVGETQVLYRIIITIAAIFAVALLSGILSLQLRSARQDLKIAQEHLKRAEKMSAVDEMISGIAHEIKNPLASLSGSIQMLRDETQVGSDADRLMQIILRETERLKQIVNDIRLIAKPSTANAACIDVGQAFKDVATLFANTPDWKDRIEITTRTEENLYVEMDPVHLQQILWNLVKNSAESIEGSGNIYLAAGSPRSRRVYLTIRDTGQGIDKAKAKQIFVPFYTTKPEGTGLGLPIIHKIVEAYDGMIDFDSIPGKGTVFTIVLKSCQAETD